MKNQHTSTLESEGFGQGALLTMRVVNQVLVYRCPYVHVFLV